MPLSPPLPPLTLPFLSVIAREALSALGAPAAAYLPVVSHTTRVVSQISLAVSISIMVASLFDAQVRGWRVGVRPVIKGYI